MVSCQDVVSMVRSVKCLVNLLNETNASPRDATTTCHRGGGSLGEKCLGIHKNIGCGSGCGILDAFVFFLKLGIKRIHDPFVSVKKANLRAHSQRFSCVVFVFCGSVV